MKVTGIIVEYNPFHNGHIHHINETKKITNCDILIAVMSGHFVQRGEVAMIDKWQRVQSALDHGVDIVIELPTIYTLQQASLFAQGSVLSLDLMKVDSICFGSESNNLDELKEIAELSINVNHLKENLRSGMGFPKAYGLLSGSFYANDILGIAYLKALQNTHIKPYCIQRTNHYHDTNLDDYIASATAIRKGILSNEDVSKYTPMSNHLMQSFVNENRLYYPMIRHLLTTLSKQYLSTLFLMDEGIESHLKKMAIRHSTYDDFINNAVTRRYTKSKIQRTLMHLLMQNTKSEVNALSKLNHVRLLGFNTKGREYLKTLKKDESLTIVSSFSQLPKDYKSIEEKAFHTYTALMDIKKQNTLSKRELKEPIINK